MCRKSTWGKRRKKFMRILSMRNGPKSAKALSQALFRGVEELHKRELPLIDAVVETA
jgi:hypothetical protein